MKHLQKTNFFFSLSILVGGLSIIGGLVSQAADTEDLFGEMETRPVSTELGATSRLGEDESASSLWTQFGDHLTAEVRVRFYSLFEEPSYFGDYEVDDHYAEQRLSYDTWVGRDTWRLHTSGWLEMGSAEGQWEDISQWPQESGNQRHYWEINELYFVWDGSSVDVTVGKQILDNGLSLMYSPANRYNPIDFNDPMDPRTLGVWQLKTDWQLGDWTLTAGVLPVTESSRLPSGDSCWLGTAKDYTLRLVDLYGSAFPGMLPTVSVYENEPAVTLDNMNYFLRAKGQWKHFDLFLSAYYGYGPYYSLRMETDVDEVRLYKELTKCMNLSGGFSTTWDLWTFYGEAVWSESKHDMDDSYVSYVLGTSYMWEDLASLLRVDGLTFIFEYAGEWKTEEQDYDGYVLSSELNRLGKNDVISRIEADITAKDRLRGSWVANLDDHSDLYQIEYLHRFTAGITTSLTLEFFEGDMDSYYGFWDQNDRVILDFTKAF